VRREAQDAGRVLGREDEAVRVLSCLMEPSLRLFRPRILRGPLVDFPSELTAAGASLYRTCCIELYNHIAENASYRRCANRACSKLFVRQKGRAKRGQHRTRGVSYCWNGCMNAASQRRHRERARSTTPKTS
jgi:hypothetical protein